MVKPLRLQKYIADCGICSRRQAEALIRAGKVTVNGAEATIGMKISTEDIVSVNGQKISSQHARETYLVYKPIGFTSSSRDIYAEKLVTELIPGTKARLYPVGRLDKNSEGLIILTNNGDLAYQTTHPKFELQKVYEVEIIPNFRERDRKILEQGITDLSESLKLDKLETLSPNRLQITLHHGKKRHIRRMLAHCHYHVARLIRTKIGPFTLADLEGKSYRKLTGEECTKLVRIVGSR
jgi:23S rRNA pseudouridine2605 synthase